MLGWSYETQITFRALGRDYRPDYGLFLSDDQQRTARATVSSREEPCGRLYLDKVAALGEAKYWERPLEERRADDRRDPAGDRGRSPHFQIIDYLRDSGVRWGILTNGRTWRLYLTAAASSEILYYEADLQAILEAGNPDVFKRFYLFFSAAAFAPDEHGRCFVDRLREESQRYATQVEDSLKERVFDSVVPVIAGGFLHHLREYRGIEVGAGDRDTLDGIYGGTLLLLYRLFFLLFAEARGLIAVGDGAGYAARSLGHLKDEIYRAMRDGVALGTTSTDCWDDLRNLFRIVDLGDSGLNVPRYNGGLFAPDGLGDPDMQPAAEFLEQNAIADRHIAEAVMLLTRHAEPGGGYSRPEFIDFRDLGVRHLGSVYEGLLEFKLNIAEEPLVQATERGKPVWKPAPDPANADRQPGDIYLTNDKRERKATGSFYTPDYIVRYIVENTIGPQVDRIERDHYLAQSIRAGEDARPPWMELLAEILQGRAPAEARAARELWDGLRSDAERREFLLNQLDGVQPEHAYDPPIRVLELKVLDPALGSGHFLVGALDYMTTRLAAMLNKYAESPVFERIRVDRTKIVESLKRQGIEADPAKLTDENLLRRTVMKRCLYGVDLNPLAVELSKLSLWLHAFTAGAPLSFLDHHVKCGNSLVGATLAEAEATLRGQLWGQGLPEIGLAIQHLLDVSSLTDASFEEADESRRLYLDAEDRLRPHKVICDLWLSRYFGNEVAHSILSAEPREVIRAVADAGGIQCAAAGNAEATGLSMRQEQAVTPSVRNALAEAASSLAGLRTFHWEVEFPEVFFERRGQGVEKRAEAGFDATVGNPPWGGETGPAEAFLRANRSLAKGQYDIWDLFTEVGLSLTVSGGSLGFVVPDSVVQPEHLPTRRFLMENSGIGSLVRIGEGSFADVFRAAFIFCTTRDVHGGGGVRTLQLRKEERDALDAGQDSLSTMLSTKGYAVRREVFEATDDYEFRVGVSSNHVELMAKMESDAFAWEDLMDDMRGVELGKAGQVVRCPECRLWMPRPRGFERNAGSCPHCRNAVPAAAEEAQIVSEQQTNRDYRPFIGGEHVNRYYLDRQLWIDTSYQGINYKEPSFFAPPKMLVRKTGVGIYAALDYAGSLTNQVVFIFQKKDSPIKELAGVSLEYVMGLLSSRAMLAYYVLRFGEREWRSFPYVTQRILKKLPLKNPNSVDGGRELHDELSGLVRQATEAKGPISKSLDLQIEDLVCALYGFDEAERRQVMAVLDSVQELRIFREILQ